MRLIDTNVILRYIAGDVPNQAKAAYTVIQNIARGKEQAIILHNVIHEACYVLTSSTPGQGYNLTHRDARDRLLPILTLEGIQIIPDKKLALQALDILLKERRSTLPMRSLSLMSEMVQPTGYTRLTGVTIAGAHRIDPGEEAE